MRGDEVEAERVGRLFEEMVALLESGHELDRDGVGRSIEMLKRDQRPTDVLTTEVLRGRKPVRPKTAGLKRYVDAVRDNDPDAYDRAAIVIMPKDYVNFRMTGEATMDRTEAACSFLMDPRTGVWSPAMCDRLGLDIAKLAPIREPVEIVGFVTAAAARETGLRKGTPVLVGGGDLGRLAGHVAGS